MVKLKNIVRSAAVTLTALFLFSCSAERLVQRAIKKDPSIVTTKIDTIYQPVLSIDTFTIVNQDTSGFSSFLDSVISSMDIDTNCIDEIRTISVPVIEYIKGKPVIQDTLEYTTTVSNDSTTATLNLRIWQEGDSIYLKSELVDAYCISSHKEVTVEKKGSLNKTGELILAGISFILFLLLLRRR